MKIKSKIGALLLSTFMVLGIGVTLGSKDVVRGDAATVEGTFEKYTTSTSGDIEEGDYLIVYENKAMKATISAKRLGYADISSYSNPDSSLVWTISKSGDYYTIYNASENKYAAGTGVKNNAQLLASGTDDKSLWTASGTDEFEFVNKANAAKKVNANLRNNGTYGFACYNTSTGGALSLYKKTSSTEPSSPLASISLTGQQTEYYVGDTLSFTGTCTATYEDGTTKEVSPKISNEVDMSTAGEKTVEVSYTEGEVTKTANYTINLNDYPYSGDGTLANPYTVKDAIFKAKQIGSTASIEEYFVKGIVNKITYGWKSSNGTISLEVKDDSSSDVFTFYTTYADKGVKFTSDPSSLLTAGTEVIGCGKIVNYNNITPEFNAGCYLYDYKATKITSTEVLSNNFKVGQSVSIADLGIKVNADIEITGKSRDVTNECTIKSGLPLVKGDNTLTIAYTQTNKYSGVTTNNTELTTEVVVKDVKQYAESIEITSTITTVGVGDSITLTAKVNPDTTDDQTIVWSSEDEDIAKVTSDSGVVTGVKDGKVNIVAKCGDVSTFVEITVKDYSIVLDSIHVDGTFTKQEYFVGDKFDPSGVTVSALYTDSSVVDITNDVTWPDTLDTADDAYLVQATYKYTENGVEKTIQDEGTLIKVVERVLDGIMVSDSFKTTYSTSDTELDMSNFSVEAAYKNCSIYVDVTDKVTIEGTIDFTNLNSQQITVSYTESGITETEVVTITIKLEAMTIKVAGGVGAEEYVKVTEDQTDWSGEYLIVYEEDSLAFNGLDAKNGNYSVTIADGKITKSDDITVTVTIAKMSSGDGYSMKVNGSTNNGKYMSGKSGSNQINFENSEQKITFAFVTDDVNGRHLQITSNSTYFRYNKAVNNERFRFYKSESQENVSLYKYTGGASYTNFTVTEDLYSAVYEADKALVCATAEGSWNNGQYDVETAKGYFEMVSEEELNAIKGAVADENGNFVERFLAKYDYLVSKNKIENFLNRSVVSNVKVGTIMSNLNNDTTIALIMVIGIASVSSIGGYFFIRKRKENN